MRMGDGETAGGGDSLDDCYIMMSFPGMRRRWVKDDEGREGYHSC